MAKKQTIRKNESLKQKIIIADFRLKLCQQLEKMLAFKDTKEFAFYQWARTGRFFSWRDDCLRLRNFAEGKDFIPANMRNTATDLITIATEYAQHNGKETNVTGVLMQEVRRAIEYDKYEKENPQQKNTNSYLRTMTQADYEKIKEGISEAYLLEMLNTFYNVKTMSTSDGLKIYQIDGDGIFSTIAVKRGIVQHTNVIQK